MNSKVAQMSSTSAMPNLRDLARDIFAAYKNWRHARALVFLDFRELRDDEGRIFPRGKRVSIPANRADRFLAAEFTLFEPTADRPKVATACGT